MGKDPGPIIHSDDCITNSIAKKCNKCKSAYHREYRRRKKCLLNNIETVIFQPKDASKNNLPILHSDACTSATYREKCKLCQKIYHQDRYKRIKIKRLDAKKNLRSDSKNKSKYVEILCHECKSKVFCKKELCKACLTAYRTMAQRNYRKKIATREKENQNDQICSDLRGVSRAESNTDCRIQTDGNLKSMCEVKNEKNDRNTNKFDVKSMFPVKYSKTLKAKKVKSTIRKKKL